MPSKKSALLTTWYFGFLSHELLELHKLSFTSAKAIQCFCIMNFESKLSVHATQTLHKQNLVLFDLHNAFCSKNQSIFLIFFKRHHFTLCAVLSIVEAGRVATKRKKNQNQR
jgi:hypothetical protein